MITLRQLRILAISVIALCLMSWTAAQAQRPPKEPPKASNAPDDNGYSIPDGPKLQDKTAPSRASPSPH